MIENRVEKYSNFLLKECLVMKQCSWSVWCQGGDIEKKEQSTKTTWLSDHMSDYIGTTREKA